MTHVNTAERHLHVKVQAAQGQRDAVQQLLCEMMEASRLEEGNLYYSVLASTEEPDSFYIMDGWASAEALAAHHDSDHVARIVGAMQPMLKGDIIVKMGSPVAQS